MTAADTDPGLRPRVRAALLLGGWCQAVWTLAAIVLSAAALAAPLTHVDFVTFAAGTGTAAGRVLAVLEHERESRHGSWIQYEHRFVYDVDGRAHYGVSWSRRRAGDDVTVEYLVDEPRTARIAGMGTLPIDPWTLLLGLGAVAAGIGWTLWRLSRLELRAAQIRGRLAAAKPYTAYGFLPKLRLDHKGRLVTWSPTTLLVTPAAALAALVWLFVEL